MIGLIMNLDIEKAENGYVLVVRRGDWSNPQSSSTIIFQTIEKLVTYVEYVLGETSSEEVSE